MNYTLQNNLSKNDEKLLLDILLNSQYALELVSCELVDIENGDTLVDGTRYKQLTTLYQKLREDTN